VSSPNQKPFIPSIEHRWALLRISKKQAWVGLTEREFSMMCDYVAHQNPSDWMMWVAGWPEWKSLEGTEKIWNFQPAAFGKDLPQPPGSQKAKGRS